MKPLILILISVVSLADDRPKLDVYQVGAAGKYCVSLTADEGGCFTGADAKGLPLNTLDLITKSQLVFHNLSDAPHDMRFTGNNAEDMPPQDAKGQPVLKELAQLDLDKQKVTCSFHGLQLGFGYRVLAPEEAQEGGGHKELGGGGGFNAPAVAKTSFASSLLSNPIPTSLADVSNFIMSNGSKWEAERLTGLRPDLKGMLNLGGSPGSAPIKNLGSSTSSINLLNEKPWAPKEKPYNNSGLPKLANLGGGAGAEGFSGGGSATGRPSNSNGNGETSVDSEAQFIQFRDPNRGGMVVYLIRGALGLAKADPSQTERLNGLREKLDYTNSASKKGGERLVYEKIRPSRLKWVAILMGILGTVYYALRTPKPKPVAQKPAAPKNHQVSVPVVPPIRREKDSETLVMKSRSPVVATVQRTAVGVLIQKEENKTIG